MKLVIGLDLGQATDHSALAAVEKVPLPKPVFRRRYRYVVRMLEEMPLGVSYPDQVRRVVEAVRHPALKGSRMGVDYTGVGRPVFDMLKEARPPVILYPMLTTSGHAVSFDEDTREFHVPKTEQVSLLQVLTQAGLIVVHEKLAAGPRFAEQLKRYKVRITRAKNEVFGADGGSNDDLVSAVMTACWLGEHTGSAGGAPTVPEGAAANAVAGAPSGVFAGGNKV